MKIWFDMDGTIADLYNVEHWLQLIDAGKTIPFERAKTLGNASLIARYMRKAINSGHSVNIVSWGSKTGTNEFLNRTRIAKCDWLRKHFPSVYFDEILVLPYGTDKKAICNEGILFDDNEQIRNSWGENAFEPKDIIKVLKEMCA